MLRRLFVIASSKYTTHVGISAPKNLYIALKYESFMTKLIGTSSVWSYQTANIKSILKVLLCLDLYQQNPLNDSSVYM